MNPAHGLQILNLKPKKNVFDGVIFETRKQGPLDRKMLKKC